MKKIIVTPAGRKRYLQVLLKNLIKCRDEFDHWEIWLNTENKEDVDYIYKIEVEHDFIKIIHPHSKVDTSWAAWSIHQFFKNSIQKDAVYLRLDDDIVFIKKGSINLVFKKRIESTENFLIYGNILNNSIISFFQQEHNNLTPDKKLKLNVFDEFSWKSGEYAEELHRMFFNEHENNNLEKFNLPDIVLSNYEHVSINAISWRGDEFSLFGGVVDPDEERWLATIKTKEVGKPNIIVGDSLFVHYSYHTQREYLDSTNILSLYEKL